MGNTVIQTMPKTSSGLLLFESFEAPTFMADQDWTLLHGVPSISPNAAKQGLMSFIMDLTYPLISHSLPSFTAGWSAQYFYDDATVVTGGFTPEVQWIDSMANVYGLGVDLAVSTTFYTKTVAGVKTATTVARTTGWHRFTLGPVSTNWVTAIDGTTCATFSSANAIATLKIGITVASGTIPFGFFDWVQATSSPFISVLNTQGNAVLYSSDGTTSLASMSSNKFDVRTLDYPFDGLMRCYDASGSTPIYNGYVRSFSGGDVLALKTLDFGRKASSLTVMPSQMRNDKFSLGGQDQSVFYNARDTMGISFNLLTDEQAQSIREFWQDLQQGAYCSLAIDSGNLYDGHMASWTYATGTGSNPLTLAPTTVGLNKGAVIRIFTETRRQQAVSTVATLVSSTQVKIAQPLQLADGAAGKVNSMYYWPVSKCTDQKLGLSLADPKTKRWNFSMNFVEVIE